MPKGEKLRFHDGMTRVAIFNDNKDPDLYTEGNEQRTREPQKISQSAGRRILVG